MNQTNLLSNLVDSMMMLFNFEILYGHTQQSKTNCIPKTHFISVSNNGRTPRKKIQQNQINGITNIGLCISKAFSMKLINNLSKRLATSRQIMIVSIASHNTSKRNLINCVSSIKMQTNGVAVIVVVVGEFK